MSNRADPFSDLAEFKPGPTAPTPARDRIRNVSELAGFNERMNHETVWTRERVEELWACGYSAALVAGSRRFVNPGPIELSTANC